MHYLVKGIEIRSENAAKPIATAAKALVDWLDQRDWSRSALDYGCGKLRYTAHLFSKSTHHAIADSKIQLDRVQRLDGVDTSIREFVKKKWPSCRIYDLDSIWRGISDEMYDFILCANVLSAIPSLRIRERSLRALHKILASDGRILVVNQHTNSYFAQACSQPGAFAYLDGWVLQSRNGGFYYGILNKESTIKLLRRFGFTVQDAWIAGQSNYVLAKRC